MTGGGGNGCVRRRAATRRGTNGSHHARSLGPPGGCQGTISTYISVSRTSPRNQSTAPATSQPYRARQRGDVRLPQADREPDDHHRVEDRVEDQRRDVRGEEADGRRGRGSGRSSRRSRRRRGRCLPPRGCGGGRPGAARRSDRERGGRRAGATCRSRRAARPGRGCRSAPDRAQVARPTRAWASQNEKAVDQRSQNRRSVADWTARQSPANGDDERAEQDDHRRVQRVVLEGERREDRPCVGHGHHEHQDERGRHDPVTPESGDHPGAGLPTGPAGKVPRAAVFSRQPKRRFMPLSPRSVVRAGGPRTA